MDAYKRKYRTHLKYSGNYLIIFAFLEIVKCLVLIAFRRDDFIRLYRIDYIMHQAAGIPEYQEVPDPALRAFVTILIVVVLILTFFVRLFIGRKAIRESRGLKTSIIYVLIGIFVVCTEVGSVAFNVSGARSLDHIIITSLCSDITSYIAICDIVYASVRLRYSDRKHNAA